MMVNLKNAIAFIVREKKTGDIAEACRRTGYSPMVYSRAIRKEELEHLTSGEYKVLCAMLDIIAERLAQTTKLKKTC